MHQRVSILMSALNWACDSRESVRIRLPLPSVLHKEF